MARLENFQIKGAPTCRVVYPQGLFEKRVAKGSIDGKEKYNAFIIVPKSDKEKIAQIEEEYSKAFEELRAKGYTGKVPKSINPKNNCYVDGDEYADEKDGREAFRGYKILKVSSPHFRPIVVDKAKRTILNGVPIPGKPMDVDKMSPEELCGGDYVFANISFWVYNNTSFQGIGCNPVAIVRAAEGEAIGGMSTDVDDYINLGDYE